MPRGLDLQKSHRDPTCRQLLHHGSSPALVHAWIVCTCRCSTTPSHLHLVVHDESRRWCRHQRWARADGAPRRVRTAVPGSAETSTPGRGEARRRRCRGDEIRGRPAVETRCGGGGGAAGEGRRDGLALVARVSPDGFIHRGTRTRTLLGRLKGHSGPGPR